MYKIKRFSKSGIIKETSDLGRKIRRNISGNLADLSVGSKKGRRNVKEVADEAMRKTGKRTNVSSDSSSVTFTKSYNHEVTEKSKKNLEKGRLPGRKDPEPPKPEVNHKVSGGNLIEFADGGKKVEYIKTDKTLGSKNIKPDGQLPLFPNRANKSTEKQHKINFNLYDD